MEEDHMRKVFIEVCCKTFIKVSADVAFLQYSTVDSVLWHFSFSGFQNIPRRKPYACVKQFSCFVIVLKQTSMKTLRMWSSSMPHVGPFMDANNRTLFRRCKQNASEREYKWYPYTRGSENPSEKSVKKLVWAPLLSELLYDIRTLGSFVHIFWRCKKRPLLSENTYDILTRAGPKTLPKKV